MRRYLSPRMLGIWPDPWETIELAASNGFEGVELLVRDVVGRGDDLQGLASRMSDLGLLAGTWPLPVDWRGDADRFRRDLGKLPDFARAAETLGLDRTGTWVLPEILDPAMLARPLPDEAALEWHVERLDAIAAILGDHGHRLGIEAVGVPSSRSGLGLRFMDRLGSLDPLLDALLARGRDVGLTVDAFHLFASGEDPDAALRRGAGAIVSVHLSDVPEGDPPDLSRLRDDRRALPRLGGPAQCQMLLRRLADAGYSGPLFVEPVPGRGQSQNVEDTAGRDAIVRRAAGALAALWPPEAGHEQPGPAA